MLETSDNSSEIQHIVFTCWPKISYNYKQWVLECYVIRSWNLILNAEMAILNDYYDWRIAKKQVLIHFLFCLVWFRLIWYWKKTSSDKEVSSVVCFAKTKVVIAQPDQSSANWSQIQNTRNKYVQYMVMCLYDCL